MAYISFDGKKSTDFDLRLINEVEHSSASKDISQVTVSGRDGVLLIDNNRLNPVTKEFPFRISTKSDLTKIGERLTNWLSVNGYKDLILSWDSDFVYRAAFLETFSISEILRQFGSVKLNFLCHPIKFYKDGRERLTVSNGQTIQGKGNVNAKPVIIISGNGTTTITINGRQTKLKDIQGGITLDMQTNQVYSGGLPAWDKVVRAPQYKMPYLEPKNNRISWDGNFTVSIIPNWGVKI